MSNNKKLFFVLCMFLTLCASISVFASSPVSVTINTNNASADSPILNCTDYIDFRGVNDSTSTNGLYCELYEDSWPFDSQYYSELLTPGKGSMSGNTVSRWYTIFEHQLLEEETNLYVHLDPDGFFSTGCLGAGKLVD